MGLPPWKNSGTKVPGGSIINYLTLLGWAPGNDEEIFTLEDTVKAFDFSKMSKKAAVYDVKKLTWLNGQYLSNLPLRKIADAAVPFFKKAGLIDDSYLPAHQEYFDHLVDVVRVRVKTLEELAGGSSYFFHDFDSYDPKGQPNPSSRKPPTCSRRPTMPWQPCRCSI